MKALEPHPEASARDSRKFVKPPRPSHTFVWSLRLLYVTFFACLWIFEPQVQYVINVCWDFLRQNSFYKCCAFETIYTVLMDIPVAYSFYFVTIIPSLQKYKLEQTQPGWINLGVDGLLVEAAGYMWPFLALDFVIVKKYPGVDPSEWQERRKSWIQTTRALPVAAPSVRDVCEDLIGAFILYDIIFFIIHISLHRSSWLYKHLHATHHRHDFLHSKVVNYLSLVERLLLVLSANESLKIMSAHPFTRNLFVPLFLSWLTENHCAYDLPWTLDKVVPFGIVAGPARHWAHHAKGDRYYEPFFTIIDDFFLGRRDKFFSWMPLPSWKNTDYEKFALLKKRR